jgi:hypothetical protein
MFMSPLKALSVQQGNTAHGATQQGNTAHGTTQQGNTAHGTTPQFGGKYS